jgi:SAM-dependent methyltransferase
MAVDLYDVREHGIEGDIEFYLEAAREHEGPILDIGVGTGRVALPLVEAGHDVTGLDNSPHMLARAQEKIDRLEPGQRERIRLAQANMVDFRLDREFALVLIPYRGFQHVLTPEEQRRSLSCIHRHLRTHGRLIIDLFDPRLEYCLPEAATAPVDREPVNHPVSGNRVDVRVEERVNDPQAQTLHVTWSYRETDEDGHVVHRDTDVLRLRWTYRYEMAYLFELTGFEVEALYGDFSRGPPVYGGEQLWVVRKSSRAGEASS